MPHTHSTQAIVLKSYDVGEADRFCVLLTKELGKVTARARGARKSLSALGAALLPFRETQLELREQGESFLITSARSFPTTTRPFPLPSAFAAMEEGVELLLALTEDRTSLPGLFDVTLEFLQLSHEGQPALLAYHLRLLHLLGFLPTGEHEVRFHALSESGRAFIDLCVAGASLSALVCLPRGADLERFRRALLAEQLNRPLKSSLVASMIA